MPGERFECEIQVRFRDINVVNHPPALVAESTFVFWDRATGAAWPIDDELRADLERFLGPGVDLRGR